MTLCRGIITLGCFLAGASATVYKPDVIQLPTGFFPQGMAIGEDWDVYIGSVGDYDGRIWKGDLKTGKGELVVPVVGSAANGLAFDKRSKYLYVTGAYSGTARIYDEKFNLVADLTLGLTDGTSYINDVIVTKETVYITDTLQPQYYKLDVDRKTGGLKSMTVETIALGEGFGFTEGGFNAAGIEASDDGKTLIITNISNGVLYKVDAATGTAAPIDLGGAMVPSADGIVLRGNTLWVVQNGLFGGEEQIAEISLSADFSCGSLSPRALTNELFHVPEKVVRKNNALYTANTKMLTPDEDRPMTEYEVLRVDRDQSEFICSA